MRLAVVADIHGNFPAVEAVAADIARRNITVVVNLGDCLSGPLLPLETARFLMAQPWLHIAGNHDRQLLDPKIRTDSDAFAFSALGSAELDWLASLPPNRTLDTDVFLCHGTPTSDLEFLLETVEPTKFRAATASEVAFRLGSVRASVVVCGHSHIPRMVHSARGQLVLNPGSVGLQAFTDTHPHPYAVETGSPNARYAILERVPSGWVAELVAVPYNHGTMAELAGSRNRADWAMALATGYVRER